MEPASGSRPPPSPGTARRPDNAARRGPPKWTATRRRQDTERWVRANLDARTFHDPETFDPTRFDGAPVVPPHLVPQGGGEPRTDHRCAGEAATVVLMVAAVRQLTQHMTYVVPKQPLRVPLNRLPALPEGFVITQVREGKPGRGHR